MITVVSGLPRSGTSLMMQMLAAGGLPPLTDGVREPDIDNPRGYYEWEPIKQLPSNPGVIAKAEAKAVKVVSSLLMHLPQNLEYRIVFLRRPLPQVTHPKRKWFGDAPAKRRLPRRPCRLFWKHTCARYRHRSEGARESPCTLVDYPDLVENPLRHAHAVTGFLDGRFNAERMAAQVKPSLPKQIAGGGVR